MSKHKLILEILEDIYRKQKKEDKYQIIFVISLNQIEHSLNDISNNKSLDASRLTSRNNPFAF